MAHVFLDFDGVLNSDRFYTRSKSAFKRGDLDIRCVKLLNELCARTKAKLVIISSWRHDTSIPELRQIMVERGFKYPRRVVGKTPDLGEKGVRGYEILEYIRRTKMRGPFVVLDDTGDMDGVEEVHIKTDPKTGLSISDVVRACRILGA